MNSAEKLCVILVKTAETPSLPQNPITIGHALIVATGAVDLPQAIGHVSYLAKQVSKSIVNNPRLSDPSWYLSWESMLRNILTLPVIARHVHDHAPQFSKDSETVRLLRICADQIRDFEAQDISADSLKELQDAANALHVAIVDANDIDASCRRTLLRIARLLLDAIQNYRFDGADGLRVAIEQFLGAAVMHHQIFGDFVRDKPERKGVVHKVFSGIASCADIVKPIAETASKIGEAIEKFSALLPGDGS